MLRGNEVIAGLTIPPPVLPGNGQEVELGLSVGVRVAPAREDDPAVFAGEHRGGGCGERSQSGDGKNDG